MQLTATFVSPDMTIPFVKYSGTGNDFIVVDDRCRNFPEHDTKLIQAMCDRHFGIGSDGLMLLREHDEFDFEMIFFNPDATQSLCGNGSRCSVHFAKELGLASESGTFITTDGVHEYSIPRNDEVEISMHGVGSVQIVKGMDFLNTGSPHLLISKENLDSIDLMKEGRQWRYDDSFADTGGTNVNFIQEIDADTVRVRTYERGVESETLSCGTGVTAVALAKKKNQNGKHQVIVNTEGGVLRVTFVRNENGFSDIMLSGPVLKIFEGVYHVGK
ncbi:diaminopimelate epimerase [Cryomorphaceae bacterium 1068]|nr:diaminopimelate epimerase [Cryomorphaceae bacterium 1068]